jgi:hypothetical protein
MLPKTNQDSLPQVVLRVPGPWKDCKELMARLPPGFRIQGERYLMPEGPDLGFDSFPADSKFPSVFRIACRRPSSDRGWSRALENYAMNAAVFGPAGSLNAAQHLLEAGAGLIRAGGLGVFIDNSVLAHVGSDWLERRRSWNWNPIARNAGDRSARRDRSATRGAQFARRISAGNVRRAT